MHLLNHTLASSPALWAQTLAQTWMQRVQADPQWAVAGLIVLLGLFVFGRFRDVLRFSLGRTRAIGSVCFAESIRRRVLWLIPLAIVGVILVSQFQRPLDEQDAVRQTTKFCLFASGMLVTITTIILACTSIPKEIDNRVIYTIVTKPTTRLEIIVGKIGGFAAVSATILLIMGLFTWGFVEYRQWSILSDLRQRLASGSVQEASAPTLRYYAENGLLSARAYQLPVDLQMFSRQPEASSPLRWMYGASEQSFIVPFNLTVDDVQVSDNPDSVGLVVLTQFADWQQRKLTEDEARQAAQLAATTQPAVPGGILGPTLVPATPADAPVVNPPLFNVEILREDQSTFIPASQLNKGQPVYLPGKGPQGRAQTLLTEPMAMAMARVGRIYVAVTPVSPGTEFAIGPNPVLLMVPPQQAGGQPRFIKPAKDAQGNLLPPLVRGRVGSAGQQLRGEKTNSPLAIAAFRSATVEPDAKGNVTFELRCVVERSGDTPEETEQLTQVQLTVKNLKTNVEAQRVVPVESRRAILVTMPADAVQGGNFDVAIRCVTPGHWVSVNDASLQLSSADRGFAQNLAKSYLMLWLLSLLVIIISIFCSTFVSWPIAVVLTLVILLGHWGVAQLADVARPGVGRQVATDLFKGAAPPVLETVNRSVEALNQFMTTVAKILPDVSRFAVMDDIDRGVSMPWSRLVDPLLVLAAFGLPVIVLSYVFLRRKEVAP